MARIKNRNVDCTRLVSDEEITKYASSAKEKYPHDPKLVNSQWT